MTDTTPADVITNLRRVLNRHYEREWIEDAICALEQARAASQPAQEPFGWLEPETENFISNRQKLDMPEDAASYVVSLYAAPPADQARQDRIMELADDYSKATLDMALQKIHPGDLMRARAALEREVRKP